MLITDKDKQRVVLTFPLKESEINNPIVDFYIEIGKINDWDLETAMINALKFFIDQTLGSDS